MHTSDLSPFINSFPSHIAILDRRGRIVEVNNAWREFGRRNSLKSNDYCVGENYLTICERCQDECAECIHVAGGIRSVLERKAEVFAFDYPCHSPTERRWFRMNVMRLESIFGDNVVVMHFNVTD
jgi:hypothetical protein